MSECCSHAKSHNEAVCPGHGGTCREVSYRTVLHHVKAPWRIALPSQRYFFCEEPDCPVVYFSEDGRRFEQSAVREQVGQKGRTGEDILCYCFDIRYADAWDNPELREYVVEQTRSGFCSCETSNPTGRCCLKDFPGTD